MYINFSQKKFEYELKKILIENKLGFLTNITDQYESGEQIYCISTKNKSVSIILFSSMSLKTSSVRKKGEDAVRIVIKWTTKNGVVYKRVCKHLRINTLFDNIEKTLKSINAFNLNYNEFKKTV